ncbi:hypothetical protein GJ496_000927 [Pomphorhynchus laevis]|nr:hypothetical protein GJ496_000927 [Pomphorhynchus laevis]
MDVHSPEQIKYLSHKLMQLDITQKKTAIAEARKKLFINRYEVLIVLTVAALITIFRIWFERKVCKPFMNWIGIDVGMKQRKFAESIFKTLFYLFTWLYMSYIVYTENLLKDERIMWSDWQLGMTVPLAYRFIIFTECAFYFHSIYATIFIDIRRSDFKVMIVHHMVTIALISVSYAIRYHKCAITVMFLHDINDVFLEGSKSITYMHIRNGREYPIFDKISMFGFGVFTLSWIITRTYMFFHHVLYSTMVVSAVMLYHKFGGFWSFLNGFLTVIFFMDLFWLNHILKMLFKIVSGQMKILTDIREMKTTKEQCTVINK